MPNDDAATDRGRTPAQHQDPNGDNADLVARLWEAERRAHSAEQHAEQAALRAERALARTRAIESSASWRITRPLRTLKRVLLRRPSVPPPRWMAGSPAPAAAHAPKVERSDPHSQGALIPIFVDAAMRSGTTLLMQLLGSSARIAFDRVYPYEHRYFRYLYELCRQIDRQPLPLDVFSSEHLMRFGTARSTDLIGPLPWGDRELTETDRAEDELWKRSLGVVWREFSALAIHRALHGDTAREAPIYYAEKSERFLYRAAAEIGPVQPILLIRDPRDVWLSIAAFDSKRGFYGFGRREGEPEDDYLERYLDAEEVRLRKLNDAVAKKEAPLVRYEDLASDLEREAARLSEVLGVRLDAESVLRQRAEHAHHMTSDSPETSAGRWRREMSDELRQRFRSSIGDELAALGYEP